MKIIETEKQTVYLFSREKGRKKRFLNVSRGNPLGFYVEFWRSHNDKEPQKAFIRFRDIPKMIDALLNIYKIFTSSKKVTHD